MKDERNMNPQPHLEENEFIECFTVPLEKLWEECRRLESEGCAIDARVGTLAEGFRIAKVCVFFVFFFAFDAHYQLQLMCCADNVMCDRCLNFYDRWDNGMHYVGSRHGLWLIVICIS